jgi:hypothetical protein
MLLVVTLSDPLKSQRQLIGVDVGRPSPARARARARQRYKYLGRLQLDLRADRRRHVSGLERLLGLRLVEEMLLERGIVVSYKTIRR